MSRLLYYAGLNLAIGVAKYIPDLACSGFEPPMDNGPVTVKGKNRALPLKTQLFEENGTEITDVELISPPVIQVFFYSGAAGDPVDVSDDALPAGFGTEGNQFVFTDEGIWQFNLKTKNYTAPGTYYVYMASGDDSEYKIDPVCLATFMR